MSPYHTIIIGAGQAGLAAGYYLKQAGVNFVILESHDQLGASWFERYDSLRLFTFSRYNDLPGLPFPGERDRFPTKDEVGNYLQRYAHHFDLPVRLGVSVNSVSRTDEGFKVESGASSFISKNVIICSGPFQTPFIPDFANHINSSILQLHSSQYRNPGQLHDGDTLVVGAGNSGVQIVEELLLASKRVYFSFSGALKSLPNNKLTQALIFGSGLTSLSKKSLIGGIIYRRQEPIMGTDMKKLFSDQNLVKVGRTIGATQNDIIVETDRFDSIRNIIWATGFRPHYAWVKLDVFDVKGFPLQERGITPINGLFFLGLAWMHSRNSGLLGGVKADAKFITDVVLRNNQPH